MNSNRKNSCWILIAVLLSLQIYVGEQQTLSCKTTQFIGKVGATLAAAVDTCIDKKYFVYDADFYTSTFVGTCLGTDVPIRLSDGISRGCLPKREITYLCGSYSRTDNGTAHGIYACTGCPAGPFKYIVTLRYPYLIASYDNSIERIVNPLGIDNSTEADLKFFKACTIELIPNCKDYDFGATLTKVGGTYRYYTIAQCAVCDTDRASPGAVTDLFYQNSLLRNSWTTDLDKDGSRLGKPCPLTATLTAKGCLSFVLSADRQGYDCNTCTPSTKAIFNYQQGAFLQACRLIGTYTQYDLNCALYDNYDLAATKGSCVKCKDSTYSLITLVDTTVVITRKACVLKTHLQPLRPCSAFKAASDQSFGVYTPTKLECTACPSGYTLKPATAVNDKRCILNDRYLEVAACATQAPPLATSITSTSITCATCTDAAKNPYCQTHAIGSFVRSLANNVLGTRCTTSSAGGTKEISGTFVRTDTGATVTVYACLAANDAPIVIDGCIGYKVGTRDYSDLATLGFTVLATPNIAAVNANNPSTCEVCNTGYTRVLTSETDKYICIKTSLVDVFCEAYYIETLICQRCKTGSQVDPVTFKCSTVNTLYAPPNCATSVQDDLSTTKYRCLACNPNFTLVQYDYLYSCVASVIGCSNFTKDGRCLGCASGQQLIGTNLCVTLPLNCKNVASNGTCLECNAGFIFSTATSTCVQVAASGSNTLVACPDGQYFDSNGVCVVGSIANCLKYIVSGASIKCSSCKTGYHTSNFGAQCDLDDPAQAGVKCADKPAGDSFVWYESPQSGACLKKDKHCGNSSFEDLDKKIVHCSTCDDPAFYPRDGRCYQYGLNANAVANN